MTISLEHVNAKLYASRRHTFSIFSLPIFSRNFIELIRLGSQERDEYVGVPFDALIQIMAGHYPLTLVA